MATETISETVEQRETVGEETREDSTEKSSSEDSSGCFGRSKGPKTRRPPSMSTS